MGIDGGGIRAENYYYCEQTDSRASTGLNFQSKDDEAGKGALHRQKKE